MARNAAAIAASVTTRFQWIARVAVARPITRSGDTGGARSRSPPSSRSAGPPRRPPAASAPQRANAGGVCAQHDQRRAADELVQPRCVVGCVPEQPGTGDQPDAAQQSHERGGTEVDHDQRQGREAEHERDVVGHGGVVVGKTPYPRGDRDPQEYRSSGNLASVRDRKGWESLQSGSESLHSITSSTGRPKRANSR